MTMVGLSCAESGQANGPHLNLKDAITNVIDRVMPRVPGELQAAGCELKPCLIHENLWEGNVGAHLETGEIILFDAGSYYAHNEMDLGIWRPACEQHFRAESYTRNYVQNTPRHSRRINMTSRRIHLSQELGSLHTPTDGTPFSSDFGNVTVFRAE
ncbi:putative protein kinase-like [Rosellinia necatrix]|uniref:Protein-ribulosamine 3-kinase n=1 Tax=Rosellinia necatrix TaxID=77044 RepID=A0A1S7ULP4_ROSNE|nr:putative protein kinase-like [Rosellinia necatrix]